MTTLTPPRPVLRNVDPQGQGFVDTFNDRRWLAWFAKLSPRFENMRFLALGSLRDIPDIHLGRLYVPLRLGLRYVAPERSNEVAEEDTRTVAQVLEERRYVVVLGDPGSGKSTLVNFLTTVFATRYEHRLVEDFGRLIPVPFVLRDFEVRADVTFDGLLDQFMAQPYWSDQLERQDLVAALERGQALVMLDGVDEIGDVGRRKALRRAVLEDGVARFPKSRWLLTSRIVAYHDVPFSLRFAEAEEDDEAPQDDEVREPVVLYETEKTKGRPEVAALRVPGFPDPENVTAPRTLPRLPHPAQPDQDETLYVLPFTTSQVQAFVHNWYRLREEDPVARKDGVESLLKAIADSPSLAPLAHTPNLLTMIALIHRVYAHLPSGRGMLYDRITEAYLESIDDFRGIRESSVPAARHRQWLGKLAYSLQRQRATQDADAQEIHVAKGDVVEHIRGVLGPDHDAESECSYIARRSGLLLPRKPGYFTFVHLSFQEYFAAYHLHAGLMSFDRREATVDDVKELAQDPLWHETLIFLFERLSEQEGASDWLFDKLMERDDPTEAQALLCAELLGDLNSGLGVESREAAARAILYAADREGSAALAKAVESLPAPMWQRFFLPAVETRLAAAPPPGPDLLLFLQGLAPLEWHWLEERLAGGALEELELHALYSLFRLAAERDGPVRNEMIRRLPVALWLIEYNGLSAVQGLLEEPLRFEKWQRQDFLAWLGALALLLDGLILKGLPRTRDRDGTPLYPDRWALDRFLSSSRFPSLSRSLSGSRSAKLGWHLARSRSLYPNRPRPPYLNLLVALRQLRSRSLSQSLSQSLSLAATLVEHPNVGVQVAATLFSGNDEYRLPIPNVPPSARPQAQLFHHLSQLVLGLGGKESWLSVLKHATTLRDPAWAREHLPYLEEGEMAEALDLLGLKATADEALFEAEWFEPGHPKATALNARPTEFVAALEARHSQGVGHFTISLGN